MNLQKMMKQAQEMQSKLLKMQEEMENKAYDGSAGGGMVKLSLSGKGKLLSVQIDPSLLVTDEKEVLEDLLVAAHHDAKQKAEAESGDAMSKLTGGMNLPAGFKLPF